MTPSRHAPLRTSMPFMPLELVDMILDHVHTDLSLLASCSLVCKAWFPSARYHLFSKTRLDADNAYPFIKLLNSASSTIANFVSHIEAKDTCESIRWLPELFPCLSRLPAVTSVSITSSFDTTLSSATLFTLSSFDNLVELKLAECEFGDFADVQKLICSFPVLESLFLEANWPEPYSISSVAGSPSPCLREVYLRCEAAHVLGWFLMLPHVAPVSKLTLHGIDASELPVVSRYLQTLGPALTHLTIFPSGSLYDHLCNHIDLSFNPYLQYIKLVIDCDTSNLLMARDLLSQVASPVFNEVELSFYSIRRNPKTADQWASLDALLATPQFSSMTRATVSAMIAASTAKDTLPQCHSRGILHIQHQ